MKRTIRLAMMIVGIALACSGCTRGTEQQVRALSQQFMQAYKEQDLGVMRAIYPAVEHIDIFYASDSATVDAVDPVEHTAQYRVSVTSYVIDPGKAPVQRRVVLLFAPVDGASGTYQIIDSEGIAGWPDYPIFEFARRTGCFGHDLALTDQQAMKRLEVARQMLFAFSADMLDELTASIRIMQVHVLGRDAGMVRARAVVSNDSDYTLPDLRYAIVYYGEGDSELGKESGWVTQEAFGTGDTVSFDFLTHYNPAATSCDFRLDFDLELIMQFVMTDDVYTGDEYASFVADSSDADAASDEAGAVRVAV